MPADYDLIRRENERRYGTDIGRIGPMLLADRYDDRTHFIFELLQNAEDALRRRANWHGSRRVVFSLKTEKLQFRHCGLPFDESDVRGICGIGEGTKLDDLTAIGRFGIGFKSVNALTDRPEIHSGDEDFAIESFVWPVAVHPIDRHADETVIILPLKPDDPHAFQDIAQALQRLGATALRFLRHIEEIQWEVEGGHSGLFLREEKTLADRVRRVTVLGQQQQTADIDESWLIFSRPVLSDGRDAGRIEIAFSLTQNKESGRESIEQVEVSPLVVFFPTVLETHFGFLVQGPYRTTPSRDNVPRNDPWNQHLVGETASLLVESLLWLRDNDFLDVRALRCLPLERAKFTERSMFSPLFDATRVALISEHLLPRFDGGYTAAPCARLARTQELRSLFDAGQLAALLGEVGSEQPWLSGDISQDRTPELRHYLMHELDVLEVTPETILAKLDASFLALQPDAWITKLYEFLCRQAALRLRAAALPLVRLIDGAQVRAKVDGQVQAFLPSQTNTEFPTVRATVCGTEGSRAFLLALGLTEPDPVDDVLWNVLPRYRREEVDVSDEDYDADIHRILTAFATDSKGQREKLVGSLRETAFVMVVDTGDGHEYVAKPAAIYLATDRLKDLFAGVPGILRVDDRYACLRGEDVRELLEACGALRYLRPEADGSLPWQERRKLREQAGHAQTSDQNDRITDWMLFGLPNVLNALPQFSAEERRTKARLLWDELAHLEERRGKGVFTGEYTWTHYGTYRATFDCAFVRLLNDKAWVPDTDGNLQRPELVLFESLGWKADPFLQARIRFKPPVIEALAKEVGIEPGVLDLLKKLGVTSEAELRSKLGLPETEAPADDNSATPGNVDDALEALLGPGATSPTPPVPEDNGGGAPAGKASTAGGSGGGGHASGGGTGGSQSGGRGAASGAGRTPQGPTHGQNTGRPFISYVGVHADEEEPDPDGLDHADRMALEEKAIALILRSEPQLRRTPTHNEGFDLFEQGTDGEAIRWVEEGDDRRSSPAAGRAITVTVQMGPGAWRSVLALRRRACRRKQCSDYPYPKPRGQGSNVHLRPGMAKRCRLRRCNPCGGRDRRRVK